MATPRDYKLDDWLPGVMNSAIDLSGCRSCGRKTQDPIEGHDGYCPVPALFVMKLELDTLRAAVPDAGGALTDAAVPDPDDWTRDEDGLRVRYSELLARAAASTRVLAAVPDAGGALTGWRLLEVGEVIRDGDEYYIKNSWRTIKSSIIGREFDDPNDAIRRRMSAQRAAPLPDAALIDAARDALEFLDALRGEGVGVSLTIGERDLYQTVSERLRAALPPAPAAEGETA